MRKMTVSFVIIVMLRLVVWEKSRTFAAHIIKTQLNDEQQNTET